MKQAVTHALAWSITAFFALVALVFCGFTFGPQLESRVLPLFKDIKGTYMAADAGHVDLLVTGVKSRNCLLTAVYATVLVNGNWVMGQAILMNQDGSKLTVQNQRIATGSPFVRLVNVQPGGASVRLVTESRCHMLWMSHQHFPEFSAIPQ